MFTSYPGSWRVGILAVGKLFNNLARESKMSRANELAHRH